MSERYEFGEVTSTFGAVTFLENGKTMLPEKILDKLNRTAELEDEIKRLKKRLFVRARFTRLHETAYTADELLEMFGPFLLYGDTEGLSPRECRVLETVADALGDIARHESAFAPVNDWYESDEHEPRPLAEKLTDAVADLQNDRQQNLKLIKMLRRIQKQSEYIDLLETEEEDSDDKDSEEIEAAKYDWAMIMGDLEELLNQTHVEPESNEPKVCVWKWDGDHDYYSTLCGEDFTLIEGGAYANNFKYCPNCGGKIESEGE